MSSQQILQALNEDGEVRNTVVEALRKDGALITRQVSATAWTDAAGQIEALQSFVRDVTAEKQARKALEESEAKFRTLAENNLVGIALIQDGTFQYLNPRYAEIYRYSRSELVGASLEALIHPGDRALVRRKIQQRLDGEARNSHYVFRGSTKDEETRFIEVYGSFVVYQGLRDGRP